MKPYLASTQYIDWQTPEVLEQAKALASGLKTDTQIAQACFEFVRDHIKHSWDYQMNPVTCRASDVLKHGTGYCCLLYTSPSPRDQRGSRMPSSA